jgi:hypothetical protein
MRFEYVEKPQFLRHVLLYLLLCMRVHWRGEAADLRKVS